jgi:glucose/arabinose dehydrogenase
LQLEDRLNLTPPLAPVIIEPFVDGQVTGVFDINMQTDPQEYFDADGHLWSATEWRIREAASQVTVWQTGFLSAPPLTLYRVDFSDGAFVGPLAGRTELNYSTNYQLVVRYRDSNNEVSLASVRNFTTAASNQPVPGAGQWLIRSGYTLDVVQTGLRLPVNVAFVPNPGPDPDDPLYYINELYGSIQVVRRNGIMSTFATGLLDYNPQGPISGTGEQGLTGLAVERDELNPDIYHLYVGMLWDNGNPPGAPNHYPKVERIDSAAGGLTMSTRTVLLNMQPETQGQSHIISNISIGPDSKLYVHMGDGFDASTALNLDQYRGKVLRMNKDGTPVATGDPAGANPFYNASNGINSRDYIYTYGHRNPFGGAWEPSTGKHWVVENGNSLDRLVDLTSGGNYGWSGNDSALVTFSKYIWNPSTAPVNIAFIDTAVQGGSMFPASASGNAYVTLSGSTYASGPLDQSKGIVEFTDLVTLDGSGKLAVPPSFLVKYNGTGRATTAALAAGPDGLYFSDLYEDTGVNGATAPGANLYRVRYVGDAGGLPPTIATPAAANPNPVIQGSTTQLTVLGDDDAGESNLTYTWGLVGVPPAPVVFHGNGTNSAKNMSVLFTENGTYDFFVAVRDVVGQSAVSTVSVTVSSLLSDIGIGVTGRYYNDIDFTSLFQTRTDSTIDFDWGGDAPIPGMGANTFSIRWTGYILPRFDETYTFTTTTDDGVRLWIGDLTNPVIDRWFDQGATSWTGTVTLNAGQFYELRMEYYENGGAAVARLEWQSNSQAREVVPQGRLFTAIPSVPNAPSNLLLSSASSSQIHLNWTDNANNEAGFRIERSTDGSFYSQIATVAANITTFHDLGLAAGTLYHYRVRATNPAGDSPFVAGSQFTRLDGDFNDDHLLTVADIDALVAAIAGGSHPLLFDMTGDGLVNLADRDLWLAVAGAFNLPSQNPYLLGDANLDGLVDGSDFGAWNSHKFTSIAAWSAGDFNADGVVDGSDFNIWNSNKFTMTDGRSSSARTYGPQSQPMATPSPLFPDRSIGFATSMDNWNVAAGWPRKVPFYW